MKNALCLKNNLIILNFYRNFSYKHKKMYFRDHINKKLDNLEAKLKHIEFHNGRENKQEVDTAKKQCEELVEELKAAVEREPRTPNEYNKI